MACPTNLATTHVSGHATFSAPLDSGVDTNLPILEDLEKLPRKEAPMIPLEYIKNFYSRIYPTSSDMTCGICFQVIKKAAIKLDRKNKMLRNHTISNHKDHLNSWLHSNNKPVLTASDFELIDRPFQCFVCLNRFKLGHHLRHHLKALHHYEIDITERGWYKKFKGDIHKINEHLVQDGKLDEEKLMEMTRLGNDINFDQFLAGPAKSEEAIESKVSLPQTENLGDKSHSIDKIEFVPIQPKPEKNNALEERSEEPEVCADGHLTGGLEIIESSPEKDGWDSNFELENATSTSLKNENLHDDTTSTSDTRRPTIYKRKLPEVKVLKLSETYQIFQDNKKRKKMDQPVKQGRSLKSSSKLSKTEISKPETELVNSDMLPSLVAPMLPNTSNLLAELLLVGLRFWG